MDLDLFQQLTLYLDSFYKIADTLKAEFYEKLLHPVNFPDFYSHSQSTEN
jgi:hypothetical protein